MSPFSRVWMIPVWLKVWVSQHLIPYLGLSPQVMIFGLFRGIFETLLLIFLGVGMLAGSRSFMNTQYTLPRHIQSNVIKWAPISNQIALKADIPREVPLVLWFKENSMKSENPESCTGIIGAYDLVRSGEHPCFEPGPISDFEVREQLIIAADEFKKRCPDISYWTQDPDKIKQCYFAYNAGSGAASRLDPESSAYVMNNYNEAYENMVYSDIELGTVTLTSLGAWPTHLAFQSLIVSQIDEAERPFSIALLDMSTRIYDQTGQLLATFTDQPSLGSQSMDFPDGRDNDFEACIDKPHLIGRPSLRPRLNPVTENPILTQDTHGCSYGLPGLDISSHNRSAPLQAPMPGEVTTYTDIWYNSTIRIENEEWIVWLLHPRSYFVSNGDRVRAGQTVGIMGAVGYATGPHVHYTIYDKVNETFVDPAEFVPKNREEAE